MRSSPALAPPRPYPVVAALRGFLLLGLTGWAALLSFVFGGLFAAKVFASGSVGLFVDDAGAFQAFGFIAEPRGFHEVLGPWSLPLFATLVVALGWLAARGLLAASAALRGVVAPSPSM